MSSPPLVDPPTMPTMVSRLPKFGSRPRSQTAPASASVAAGSARLTNGFYHHPGPAGVNGTSSAPAKQNGFIRAPGSFSPRWRRENEVASDGAVGREAEWRRGRQYFSPVPSQQDAIKPTCAGKRPGQPSSSSLSPSPQSSPRTLPASKTGSLGTRLSQTPSGLTSGTRQTLYTSSGSKPQTKAVTSLRQPQSFARSAGSRLGSGPGPRSGSPLYKKPAASRSHSSETLGCISSSSLTEDDRFRSRSLTQVRQQPSPTLTSSSTSSSPLTSSSNITRSFSISRAAQWGTRGSSPQAPPRGSLLKPPANRHTGRNIKGPSSAASGLTRVSGVSQLPQSTLKKPLLPDPSPASKSSGISYKLSRPSLIKQPRPLRVIPASQHRGDQDENRGPNGRRKSVETPLSSGNSPG